MIHASEKYNRIQDPDKKIGEDEPVFLLRAQDRFAPVTIEIWAALVRQHGNAKLADQVEEFIKKMDEWQARNPTKIPD